MSLVDGILLEILFCINARNHLSLHKMRPCPIICQMMSFQINLCRESPIFMISSLYQCHSSQYPLLLPNKPNSLQFGPAHLELVTFTGAESRDFLQYDCSCKLTQVFFSLVKVCNWSGLVKELIIIAGLYYWAVTILAFHKCYDDIQSCLFHQWCMEIDVSNYNMVSLTFWD